MSLAGTILLTSIPLLIHLYAEKYRLRDLEEAFPDDPPDFSLPILEKFDFIVVGAGAAGAIMANRLSEKFTVLLLEAGGDPPPLHSIPMAYPLVSNLPDINFLFHSTPQANVALNRGGITVSSMGKCLGGSTIHNGLMVERGHALDYERWANVTGDSSWLYPNILKYFKKTENYIGNLQLNEDQHGHDGPIHMQEDKWSPGGNIFLEAGQELGYPIVDSNGPQLLGFSETIFNKYHGRRESTYTGYIKPIQNSRPTLTIRRYSYVSEVIFDETKTAIGVTYTRHGIPRAAFVTKEVILSAGAYISPIILIKSGVGPVDQLTAAKVKPVSVLPVGHNLMDHIFFTLNGFHVDEPKAAFNLKENLTFQHVNDFVQHGVGPLTGVFQGSQRAVIASSRRVAEGFGDWPDLMIFHSYMGLSLPNTIMGLIGFNHPLSRGTVKLNTSATSMADDHLPLLDFNYFAVESDMDVAVEGIKFFFHVVETTTAYRRIGARYVPSQSLPPCDHLTFRSDEYWKCYIRQTSGSGLHPAGTCKMGRGREDPTAVVDSKLRVIGVKNLRVVDASVMPFVVNANTMTPTMMIAEKTAAQIIQEYA